jgi:polyisoprenyl-phosphate glycosyltransferase
MPDTNGSPRLDDVVVLIPVFNDWGALTRLVAEIDAVLETAMLQGRIAVVDDASTVAAPDEFLNQQYRHLSSVEVIRLLCGLGHQRAIAVGLAHLNKMGVGAKAVVVMDGDGEDRPMDIPRLVEELTSRQCGVVFAARIKRTESFLFRFMYLLFRFVHKLLTGVSVYGGNFSSISPRVLPQLLASPDLWNHYAGTVVRSRVSFLTVPLPRGKRYVGPSHMSYTSLVIHGLSAVSLSGAVVGVRLMILFAGLFALLSVLVGAELLAPSSFSFSVSNGTALLILFVALGFLSSLFFVLAVLGRRSEANIVPAQGAERFIESVACLSDAHEREGQPTCQGVFDRS